MFAVRGGRTAVPATTTATTASIRANEVMEKMSSWGAILVVAGAVTAWSR